MLADGGRGAIREFKDLSLEQSLNYFEPNLQYHFVLQSVMVAKKESQNPWGFLLRDDCRKSYSLLK